VELHDLTEKMMTNDQFIFARLLTVAVEAAGGPIWLQLTGREGVKPFIQAEIGEALNDTVAKAAHFR
jgi:hypothetical protein